jgi:hypothetical protein
MYMEGKFDINTILVKLPKTEFHENPFDKWVVSWIKKDQF